MFIVEVLGERYFFNRLCMQFTDIEVKENLEKRRVEAMHLAKSVFHRVNIEYVLIEEVLKLRPELRQPAFLTNQIEKYLGLKRMQKLHPEKEYDLSKIRAMVEQFEALYCYSNCKSILMSEVEEENPLYSCLVTGFSVERNNQLRAPYYGLKTTNATWAAHYQEPYGHIAICWPGK